MSKETYTDTCGELVEVDSLVWLEDGQYYDKDAEEWRDCSRYCTNADDEDSDGESVWLNTDGEEVEV